MPAIGAIHESPDATTQPEHLAFTRDLSSGNTGHKAYIHCTDWHCFRDLTGSTRMPPAKGSGAAWLPKGLRDLLVCGCSLSRRPACAPGIKTGIPTHGKWVRFLMPFPTGRPDIRRRASLVRRDPVPCVTRQRLFTSFSSLEAMEVEYSGADTDTRPVTEQRGHLDGKMHDYGFEVQANRHEFSTSERLSTLMFRCL